MVVSHPTEVASPSTVGAMDSDRARRLIVGARLRPSPAGQQETPEQVREGVWVILSRHAPPARPDPLTGRVVGMRRLQDDEATLTAPQLHRRIMEIASQAGHVPTRHS